MWKEGDVVMLKSGGPLMTVVGSNSTFGGFICTWFEKGKVETHTFAEAMLQKAED